MWPPTRHAPTCRARRSASIAGIPDEVRAPATPAGLFRAVGLMPDGPALLGRPIRAAGPGAYPIELTPPHTTAPVDLAAVGRCIERVPNLSLDWPRPTPKAPVARLASF